MDDFTKLNLSPALTRALADLGFTKPTPIQAEALPILMGEPTDFIGLAATGTGKTAAFGIPLLERLNPAHKAVQALILCPTRELTVQVSGQIDLLAKHTGIRSVPIYGGADYGEQIQGLKRGSQVAVGTPGRLLDHLDRGRLKLDAVQVVVLDEADEMISMGFREDMENILSRVPRDSGHVWLFSATMSSSVRKVAEKFLRQPRQVQVNRGGEMLSATVEQFYYMTQEKNKPEVLCKLIDAADSFYGLVFCQTKTLVTELTRYLGERGYRADSLHGDKSQAAREQTLRDFRSRRIQILVATDVAARGLDVQDVTHVVNYSLPRELDNYVHRIGRTARSGKTGVAMSLVTASHRHLLRKIENLTKSQIREGAIPTRKALGDKKITRLLSRFLEQKNFARATELLNEDWRQALTAMSGEEITGRFLSLTFPEIFADRGDERPRLKAPPGAAAGASSSKKARGGHDRGGHGERGRDRRDAPDRRGWFHGDPERGRDDGGDGPRDRGADAPRGGDGPRGSGGGGKRPSKGKPRFQARKSGGNYPPRRRKH